jgi:hypothetical protein
MVLLTLVVCRARHSLFASFPCACRSLLLVSRQFLLVCVQESLRLVVLGSMKYILGGGGVTSNHLCMSHQGVAVTIWLQQRGGFTGWVGLNTILVSGKSVCVRFTLSYFIADAPVRLSVTYSQGEFGHHVVVALAWLMIGLDSMGSLSACALICSFTAA